jgi:hypothetical protein
MFDPSTGRTLMVIRGDFLDIGWSLRDYERERREGEDLPRIALVVDMNHHGVRECDPGLIWDDIKVNPDVYSISFTGGKLHAYAFDKFKPFFKDVLPKMPHLKVLSFETGCFDLDFWRMAFDAVPFASVTLDELRIRDTSQDPLMLPNVCKAILGRQVRAKSLEVYGPRDKSAESFTKTNHSTDDQVYHDFHSVGIGKICEAMWSNKRIPKVKLLGMYYVKENSLFPLFDPLCGVEELTVDAVRIHQVGAIANMLHGNTKMTSLKLKAAPSIEFGVSDLTLWDTTLRRQCWTLSCLELPDLNEGDAISDEDQELYEKLWDLLKRNGIVRAAVKLLDTTEGDEVAELCPHLLKICKCFEPLRRQYFGLENGQFVLYSAAAQRKRLRVSADHE